MSNRVPFPQAYAMDTSLGADVYEAEKDITNVVVYRGVDAIGIMTHIDAILSLKDCHDGYAVRYASRKDARAALVAHRADGYLEQVDCPVSALSTSYRRAISKERRAELVKRLIPGRAPKLIPIEAPPGRPVVTPSDLLTAERTFQPSKLRTRAVTNHFSGGIDCACLNLSDKDKLSGFKINTKHPKWRPGGDWTPPTMFTPPSSARPGWKPTGAMSVGPWYLVHEGINIGIYPTKTDARDQNRGIGNWYEFDEFDRLEDAVADWFDRRVRADFTLILKHVHLI